MPLTRDVVNIPVKSLSPLSQRTFQKEVLEYQLRLLFMRGPDTYDELRNMIRVDFKEGQVIVIEGPQYSDSPEDTEIPDGPFTENWRVIFDNYLLKPGFIDALVQLRIVTVNPISIYYQLLANEARIFGQEIKNLSKLKIGNSVPRLSMKRAILEFPEELITPEIKLLDYPFIDKPIKGEERKVKNIYDYSKTTFGDGHVQVERDEGDIAGRGTFLGKFAEGFVDESIPEDVPINPLRDHPTGLLMNIFPGYPFFAFNYRNVYPKIHDINRMIESGMQIVFVDRIDEDKPLRLVEAEYRRFFNDWGIPVIDYVTSERISLAEMKSVVEPPENVSGVRYVNIPNFFVIQRPIEKFHSAAWCGMNTERRRGLGGIPWAKDQYGGLDISSPQPDDGFLSYFIKEGVLRRFQGKNSVQVFFPLCTILTEGEIAKLMKTVERALKRPIKYIVYQENSIVGVFLRSMGEWVLLRAVLRKYL